MKTVAEVIETLEQSRERAFQNTVVKVTTLFPILAQLCEALGQDINRQSNYWFEWPTFHIEDLKQFVTIKKIVGRLEKGGVEAIHQDARRKDILVSMRPANEKYHCISFKYQTKLPTGAKCKLKRVKSNYISVQCSR